MPMKTVYLSACLLAAFAMGGCNGSDTENGEAGHEDHEGHAGHGHGLGELWMEREGIDLGDCKVALGFHGDQPHAGEELITAARVTQAASSSTPVEDAEVYASIVDAQGNVIAEEVSLAFHEGHDGEQAHYDAADELMVPADAQNITIRYRVVLADGTSETYDVTASVLHHD